MVQARVAYFVISTNWCIYQLNDYHLNVQLHKDVQFVAWAWVSVYIACTQYYIHFIFT